MKCFNGRSFSTFGTDVQCSAKYSAKLKKKKEKRSKLRTPFYKSKHMDIVLTNFLLRFSHADGGAFTLGSV